MVAIPLQQPVFAALTLPSVRADAALNLLSSSRVGLSEPRVFQATSLPG